MPKIAPVKLRFKLVHKIKLGTRNISQNRGRVVVDRWTSLSQMSHMKYHMFLEIDYDHNPKEGFNNWKPLRVRYISHTVYLKKVHWEFL